MPKMKTHSGAKKRFKITAGGKVRGRHSFTSHILEKKSPKRKRHHAKLGEVPGVEIPFPDEWVDLSGHFAFPVLVSDRATRDAVREAMQANGVQSTFYPSLTQLSVYEPAPGTAGAPLAEEFADRHMALPLSPSMGEEKIEIVVEALSDALSRAGAAA